MEPINDEMVSLPKASVVTCICITNTLAFLRKSWVLAFVTLVRSLSLLMFLAIIAA